MKRKLAALLTALFLLLPLAGCRNVGQSALKQDDTLSIVSTIFAPYDFARELTKGVPNVTLTMLLKPGGDSHSFEPTPQDIITLQNADLFLYAGGESDEWVNTLLESTASESRRILSLIDCVEALEEETIEGMTEHHHHQEEDGSHEEEAHEYDEHVWTSPKNAMRIVEEMSQTLAALLPEYAERVAENTESYLEKLAALDESFRETVNGGVRREIIMGDRFPFLYFAKEYGLEYYAAFSGCASDSEPSVQTMAFLIDKVKEDNIPVVFHIELTNESIADTICAETGAKKLLLHACHNISKADFAAGESYLSLMEKNVENLKEALS